MHPLLHRQLSELLGDRPQSDLDSDELLALVNQTYERFVPVDAAPLQGSDRSLTEVIVEAIDELNEGFALFSPDDTLLVCNKRYREMFAPAADVLVPGTHFDTIARTVADRMIAGTEAEKQAAIDRRKVAHMGRQEEPYIHHLANDTWYQSVERSLKSGHIVGNRLDITAVKRAERALAEANERLRTEVALKDRFFSIIGHDLRSPFGALLGLSQFVVGNADKLSKEDILDYVDSINESGERLYELLDNLLQWARFQMEKQEIPKDPFKLGDAIRQTADVLGPVAKAKGVQIHFANSSLVAVANKEMIKLVIRNLVANAIKFTPRGGDIRIVASLNDTGGIVIKVQDTGVGIAPALLGDLFALDIKTTTSGTEGEIGTGLGLPLCREMMEANGGEIRVESVVGEGTTFTLLLPKAD